MTKHVLLYILVLSSLLFRSPAVQAASGAEEERDRLLVIPLKVKGGVSKDEAALLTDILSTEIHRSGKFTILNRDDMKAVLDEKEFELAMGCDDNVCLLENVSKLSVNKIITGNIGKLGKKYIVSIRMINEDGENETMERESCACEIDALDGTIEKITRKFLKYLGGDVARYGAIRVESTPRGARVYLDGVDAGTAPDTIGRIDPGSHSISVRKDGYRDWSKRVDVEAGEETVLKARLQKRSSSISIRSEPSSADIYIDGRYSGITPDDVTELKPGRYKVEVRKEGYRTWSKSMDVKAGEGGSVMARLAQEKAQAYSDTETGMELVLVKGGCYEMGDTFGDGDDDEKPVHEVCLDDFYIGKYEVTVGEFRRFVNDTGYRTEAETGGGMYIWTGKKWKKESGRDWRSPGFSQTDSHPVVGVSWNDAQKYINWLNRKSGKRYRLPTEAEWEYAARSGGERHKYSWGNGSPSGNIADEAAKRKFNWVIWEGYDDGYVYTAPVGRYRSNEAGLYDMTGNVLEWCKDIYSKDAYRNHQHKNPVFRGSGSYRVYRGDSWGDFSGDLRASNRDYDTPDGRNGRLGFRLARTP